MTKAKRNTALLMVLLLLVAITALYVSGTYAKYTAEITGKEGTAVVAKWDFDTENSAASKTLEIALDGTYDATTLVANKIAPGTQGSFAIKLTNKNSETGVDFTLTLGTIEGKPENLLFYADSEYKKPLTAAGITGKITAGDETGIDAKIYWKWAYETTAEGTTTAGDTADTTAGRAAATLKVPVTITGVQTQPGAAITTHIDPVN